ncbi:alpha-amylase family glycosyl hydrolase [Fulvivirga ligni]|uniref:alpha-amylase family glycosyl hydrolase n=1 Tax=Fulvivirga ligni TaxID=2904246 RepID=UPI001F1C11D5|nr:alpha-amylase family glycosyl hydrolase [Fulvivirga ligni]UII21215.1 alpha-glucosidase C-terminal domain-containing protein [Fulvivirga ligni]
MIDRVKKLVSAFLVLIVFVSCGEDEFNVPKQATVEVNEFSNVPAIKDIIMYEVNLRAFSRGADLDGVTERLDYLQDLGVNTIWLMPIYPIGQVRSVNSPYSISNYTAVNAELGTINNLRKLVNEAHSRDMAVILDWVANHTAWDHPWVTEHPTWYTQDGAGNIMIPANTGWEDVADLNYSNSGMRQEMIKSMEFWLDEAGIDGFRFDAVDFVPEDFWSDATAQLNAHSDKDLILLAEGGAPVNFQSGFDLNYAFDFNNTLRDVFGNNGSANLIFNTNASEYTAIGDGLKLRYSTNHDVYGHDGTLNQFYKNDAGSLAAFATCLYMKGIPLIYTGQEINFPNLISFFDYNYLPWDSNPGLIQSYQELLSIRKDHEVFIDGDLISYPDNNALVYVRENDAEKILVMINVRNATTSYTLPEALQNTSWSNLMSGDGTTLNDAVTLNPFEIQLLKAN